MADAPTPDELRAIAIRARNSSGSASDDCGPSAYVLAGWNAAIAAQPPAAPLTGGDERRHIICLCPDCVKPSAAITQAADAGAAEPVATVEALQSRIAELEAELDNMEAERDEALRGPWPEWAERMKTTIRKYSGYDGIDDASDGIDLPAELDDLIEHVVEPPAQQLQQAVARAVEKCAVICEGMHEEDRPGDYAAAIRQQGTP